MMYFLSSYFVSCIIVHKGISQAASNRDSKEKTSLDDQHVTNAIRSVHEAWSLNALTLENNTPLALPSRDIEKLVRSVRERPQLFNLPLTSRIRTGWFRKGKRGLFIVSDGTGGPCWVWMTCIVCWAVTCSSQVRASSQSKVLGVRCVPHRFCHKCR